ncbi:MAG TPA: hypothetical protein VG433_03330, partial [Pirellulales bacterium]|nr:hypothetical protein [Pirellulales bacterium]
MNLLKQLALQSPNAWGNTSVLEGWIAPSAAAPVAAERLPAVAQRLVECGAPYFSLAEFPLPAAPGGSADFALATWLAHLARKIQGLAGADMPAGLVLESADGTLCRAAIVFEDEGLARPALALAYQLLTSAIAGTSIDFAPRLAELQALANELCLGPSTRAIVSAARARGIPVRRLNEEASFVQFGQGARQRRICTAETDGTGAIAESIAQDKELTKSLLSRAGVPVPKGRAAENAEDAWQAACEVGLPVVVKPRDANHGRGVAIKLSLPERIMAAYDVAAAEGTGVLVEQFVVGTMHRVLVVDKQAVAVSRGQPEEVVGDGVHTISQLVGLVNEDPRRGDEYALPFCRLKIDRIARLLLEHQGYETTSVPEPGVTVVIRRNGEYTTDVTDQLHPEVAARAVMAARVVGLDVAGIDIVASDISRPLEEQGGMVIEVNAGPGLQMHSEPQVGRARPVGAAIVETLFPDGHTGRIPVVAVTAGRGSTLAAQAAAHLVRGSGQSVGLACAAGT